MSNSRLVYSTEFGRACPDCGRPIDECVCRRGSTREPGDGVVRVRLERSGRRGKTVTTISGLPLDDAGLEELARELKRRSGSGGTAKDGVIVIQGDHAAPLVAELRGRGYTVKRAGG